MSVRDKQAFLTSGSPQYLPAETVGQIEQGDFLLYQRPWNAYDLMTPSRLSALQSSLDGTALQREAARFFVGVSEGAKAADTVTPTNGIPFQFLKSYNVTKQTGTALVAGDLLAIGIDGSDNLLDSTLVYTTDADAAVAVALQSAASADTVVRVQFIRNAFHTPVLAAPQTSQELVALYDFALYGGAVGTISLDEQLPNRAIVTNAWYWVETALASAGGTATMKLGTSLDDDMFKASTIVTTPPPASLGVGSHGTLIDGSVGTFGAITTAATRLRLTVGTEDLTAGKLYLHVEYSVN